jgi:hypothetical protein
VDCRVPNLFFALELGNMSPQLPSGLALKPSWQCAISCVGIKFLVCHALEEIPHADLLVSVHPLPRAIDLAIRLNCGDHGGTGYLHLANPLDEALQCGSYILLPLFEQPKRVGVSIDS